MEAISFRGKRKDTGEWVKGGSVIQLVDCIEQRNYFMPAKDDKTVVIQDHHDNIVGFDTSGIFYAIQPKTIGRSMERTDADGTPIYEGDIVQCGVHRFVVLYGECGGVKNTDHDVGYIGFYFKDIDVEENYWRQDPIYYLNAYPCKVIGNIHDNPELLPMEAKHEND